MFVIIGFVIVLIMVFGSFTLSGGKFDIILHALPFETAMILGASIGAFIIANSMEIIKASIAGMGKTLKGGKWSADDYRDLLSLMFVLIKTMRSKGVVAVEGHIEHPDDSKIFQYFESISADHHVVLFICDYMRMMTMNFDDPHQMEDAMDKDIDKHHEEAHEPQHALLTMADGLPALGIVAAVLGIIKTMASISEPVEILGQMIGGALTGTFLGIFFSYTLVGPIAARFGQILNEEGKIFDVIKAVLISYMHGNAPQIAVEIGRRNVPSHLQPSFLELEEHLDELPPDL
ncbi:MAG: flagellar motor stator protein MotA [Sphingomonadales bacterium]